MKLVMTRGCVVNRKKCKKGETVEVEAKEDVNLLIAMGHAVDAKNKDAVAEIEAQVKAEAASAKKAA